VSIPKALVRQTRWETESPVHVGVYRQFTYFLRLFDLIQNVPGDVVECGVGDGGTFCMLAYLTGSEPSPSPRTLWGFDSFAGWPEPAVWDRSPRNPQKGEWKIDQQLIWSRLEASKILQEYPDLHINIVPGFFAESLPQFPARQIAFLHIDADLYPSYRDALHHLFPKVAEGGVVCFDEYREIRDFNGVIAEKWPGATKAVDEYFADLPYTIRYFEETDKYYVIKR